MPEKKQIQWEALALVFLLALGYRTLGFILTGDHPLFLNPVVDAGYHFNWAKRIASGDLFGHGPDDVFKPPLYCYILSIITRISQNDISLIQWWQMFLGAFSSVMISWIATCFFNKQTGIIAGVLSAVYAPFLFFETPRKSCRPPDAWHRWPKRRR